MAIYTYEEKRPNIHPSAFIHPQACIMGDVTIGKECFIGAGAVIRGDYGSITLGDNTNVQENAVIHAQPGASLLIGNQVLIGHGAIIHCTKVEDGVSVGMGAIVSHGCHLEANSMLGAGSLLPPGKTLPQRILAVGSPAKAVREQDDKALQSHQATIVLYSNLCEQYRQGLVKIQD